MHRSRTADDLLSQYQREKGIDLLIISEQYKEKTGTGWYADSLGTAAIWIPNPKHRLMVNQGISEGHCWIKLNDITYVSCYFTPNEAIADFERKLDLLEDTIRVNRGKIIVAGDFNAKASEWGANRTDSRGRRVLELMARTGLVCLNTGNTTTFRRVGYTETVPDLTFASETVAGCVCDWKVLEDYTASDHQYIWYTVRRRTTSVKQWRTTTTKWNVRKLNEPALVNTIDACCESITHSRGSADHIASNTMALIRKACEASMPKKRFARNQKNAAYWWTAEIAELRRSCLKIRRRLTRLNRRNPPNDARETEELKNAKKILKVAIRRSKKKKWEEMREDVERDPWGLGYKIAMKKLGQSSPPAEYDAKEMSSIVDTLFPQRPTLHLTSHATVEEVPLFTHDELAKAAGSLQNRKAPGPDGIPAEALKIVATACPEVLLHMYNACLKEGRFFDAWKEQKLVLVRKKNGDCSSPKSHRPLCMLDVAGKLMEKLLRGRLSQSIQHAGGLADTQHGFRQGRSTIGAATEIVRTFNEAQLTNQYSRKIVVLVTLDVRNAFNSARWEEILRALDTYSTPRYLTRIVGDYFTNRTLTYDTTEGPKTRIMTCGVAQGSVLGPELWNVLYDGVLRIDMPEKTFLVAYADDLAAVTQARNVEEAQIKINQIMRRVITWMDERGLALATEKTEILMLTRRRIPLEIQFRVADATVTSKKAAKYLGITLDSKVSFRDHIKAACERAGRVTMMLSRIMANVGGPSASKRRLLIDVANAILLYGCEVWAENLTYDSRKRLIATQRRGALRVASAYKTVSGPAVLVIAGVPAIDLLANARKEVYETKTTLGATEARRQARERLMAKWQQEWQEESRGRWTARLIPDVQLWHEREHGEVDYYMTQFLSGHGYFRKYLHTVGKAVSPACPYHDGDVDDAEHTFFVCERWRTLREELVSEVGQLRPETVVTLAMGDETTWRKIASFVSTVLKQKKKEMDAIPQRNPTTAREGVPM